MPPTAAAPRKTTNPVTEFEQLQAAHRDAHTEAETLARDHWSRTCAIHGTPGRDEPGLLAQLNRLRHHHPEQFHPDDSAIAANSEAGRLISEIDKLNAGLGELAQRVAHARALATVTEQRVTEHVRANLDAILDARKKQGAERVTSMLAHLEAARRDAEAYLNKAKVTMGLVAAGGGDTRRVKAFDTGSELVRQLNAWTELPNPAVLR